MSNKMSGKKLKFRSLCIEIQRMWNRQRVIIPVITGATGLVEHVWNVMTHAQKPDLVFQRNGRVHLNWSGGGGGGQFSRLLAAEECASAVVMLDTPCSEVVWRVLATHCIRQFPLSLPLPASACAITFQLDYTAQSSCLCRASMTKHFIIQQIYNYIIRGYN